MNLKKIQAMPFAPFHEESKVRWKVTVKEPVGGWGTSACG